MIRFAFTLATSIAFAFRALAAVDIQEVTSPGGIKAWLVEEHSIPFTALEIRFKGGASLDAEGKRGAINLMSGLLDEGAGDLDSRAFSAAREDLAASIRFNASDDAVSVSARFLTENRAQAVDLIRLAVTEPRFDEDAIDRVRGQVLASIASDARDPNAIAAHTFAHLAFPDDPYGTAIDGTEESVRALTRDDLIAAKDRVMARDRVVVSAVGDIDAGELGRILDEILGPLPATGADMPPAVSYDLAGGTTVVDFDTPQSVILFGQPGIDRDDPDFFPAFVLNEVLGGGRFTARLMKEVREKRGLTYGIYTSIANYDRASYIVGSVATVNARAGETLSVIRDEWAKAQADGITQEELDATKTYLIGAYPLRFDGNATIARILVGMQAQGYGPDYITRRNDFIEAVTLEGVKRVAAKRLAPEKLHFVVVGHPEGVTAN
ncbi:MULTISPECIES: M16 family metallopeptidase [unclassified Haematobacter]|uniref:M16 family metallopeptidase n=1 Tax=unclassified Haematobacter TaxID=2640585 RepID=UPI0025BAA657|nr:MULTISPECIES: pitrilysin family protein [unclassified Haematobacter]